MKRPLPKFKSRKAFEDFVTNNDLGNYLEAHDLKRVKFSKSVTLKELANSLGVNLIPVREKHKLIQQIVKARKDQKLSQSQLAKKAGVTQGRIAQIESGIGTSKVTFDSLLHMLALLGYEFKIMSKKAA